MSDTAWRDAVADKTLRVAWQSQPPPGVSSDVLVAAVFRLARERHPALRVSQDESFTFVSFTPAPTGGWRAQVDYVFDHDFASQYDQTERHAVELDVDAHGVCVARWA